MMLKIVWNDDSITDMIGDYKQNQIDILNEQLKREPKKRLYRLGIDTTLIKRALVNDNGIIYYLSEYREMKGGLK